MFHVAIVYERHFIALMMSLHGWTMYLNCIKPNSIQTIYAYSGISPKLTPMLTYFFYDNMAKYKHTQEFRHWGVIALHDITENLT